MKIKINKNRKGSVLLLMVLVIGILSVLGTTVLSAALSNYKMGLASSNLKSNIYITEAGLDEAYSNIYKGINVAIVAANTAAEGRLDDFTKDMFEEEVIKAMDKEINNIGDGSVYVEKNDEDEYVYKTDVINEEVSKEFGTAFEEKFITYIKGLVESDGTLKNLSVENEIVYLKDKDTNIFDDSLVFSKNSTPDNFFDDLLTLYIASEYKGTTERNAEVYLDITVPEYGKAYTVSYDNELITVNPVWGKVIASDGEVIFSGVGTNKANGDIFSKEDVIIDNGKTFDTSGNIASQGDLILKGNNVVKTGSLYVKNIYLTGADVSFTADLDTNPYKGVYVYDDLEMKGKRQNVFINTGYYGFNDGSSASSNASDKSSGININSSDIRTNSSIKFAEDLYLYGTSYISLYDDVVYQTGESISVKGNYLAYTMPITGSDAFTFSYKDPLTLVDSKNGSPLTVFDKADYFEKYYEDKKGLANKGGLKLDHISINESKTVTLGDVINAGAVINKKDLNYMTSSQINDFKQKENVHHVYTRGLGDLNIAGDESGNITFENIDTNFYMDVGTEVNFSEDFENHNDDIGVLKSVKLITVKDGSLTTINLGLVGDSKYMFVVTNGNVEVKGNGTFNGCIIAEGNVTVSDSCTMNYNERVVIECLAKYPWLKDAFTSHAKSNQKSYLISSELAPPGNGSNIYTNVDYSSLLEFHDWNITYD